MIQEGNKVKFHFTLHADGELIESTKGEPFEYTHGEDNILPGLVSELEGMEAEQEKTFELPPEKAYGDVKEDAYQEAPRSALPQDLKPEIGMTLQLRDQQGQTKLATVSGLRDDSVILNFNHPLAGKTLKFDVKILEVSA